MKRATPLFLALAFSTTGPSAGADEFFTDQVEPLLKKRCYECHSHEGEIEGGLALDSRAGWEHGGESGPAIVPGKPESSLLILAISHAQKDLRMPPKKMLPPAEVRILTDWVRQGALDPRGSEVESSPLETDDAWEDEFRKRLDWWSLKPLRETAPPEVAEARWQHEPVDRFVRAAQDKAGLAPAAPAGPEVLRRRLSFVLTGLPPSVFPESNSPEDFVEILLASPHFGERFARHWMDVVRYTDTYGYEWDNPAKGSHEYRDYLIRAFNDDLGYDRLLREHLAGDLLPEPRIHPDTHTNECLIGPMFYHLGEHRHGSSLMFNGIHQEMVNNKIDAFSKAFLATTVACARCHDHKLEAVSQRDYYALAAMFTTPRWTSRVVDAPGKNDDAIAKLKTLRDEIRGEMAARWSGTEMLQAGKLKQWATEHRASLENAKPQEIAYPLAHLLQDTLWLKPGDLRATAEATTFSIENDHSILATGTAPEKDRYVVKFTTDPGPVSRLRLEALTHASLPARGPGRTNRGNFVLNGLHIDVAPRQADGSPGVPKPVALATVRASYAQPGYEIESLLKPGGRGWAVGLAPQSMDHTAHFTFAETVDLPHGGEWTITLEQSYGTSHLLGRFRIQPGRTIEVNPESDPGSRWQELSAEWRKQRVLARKANEVFQNAPLENWVFEGDGFAHGRTDDATPLIALEGETVFAGFLAEGWHTHALSSKLPGSLRMPPQHLVPGKLTSLKLAGGGFGGHLVVDDHAFQNETVAFYTNPEPGWRSFADAALINGAQQVTVEFCTSSLNPNFPPRTGLAAGLPNQDFGYDKRSWISITGIVTHDAAGTPQDELAAFSGLYESDQGKDPWENVAAWFGGAVNRWCEGHPHPGDREVLGWLLAQGLLPNGIEPGSKLAGLVADYRRIEAGIGFSRTANSMDERKVMPVKYPLNVRGNVDVTGELVAPASLRMLHGEQVENRLALAESLLAPGHPLTARVYVNRVWQWIFGTGLVATPDDFGRLGDVPSHPELLDWLAREFVREGWSTKQLVRRLVQSETFRQSGTVAEAARERDPENRLLHHYPTRRLEAEAIRDSLLAVSGRLDPRLYGRPVLAFRSAEDDKKRLFSGPLDGDGRRSLYLQMSIMDPPKFLTGFNLPDLKLPAGKRDVTNVPAQALVLLNDPFVHAMAAHWSARILREPHVTPEERLRSLFRTAFGRDPDPEELARWNTTLRELAGKPEDVMTSPDLWTEVAHTLFNSKEFIYYR
jgi:hypothetical protein